MNWRQILQQVLTLLEAFGTEARAEIEASIDFEAMLQIAERAELAGGVAAVIPALISGVSQYCTDPGEAMLIVFALHLAQQILPAPPPPIQA